ncbi:MAG: 1-acyl-sn-glycerol-3-phosphate acyltransferase [Akkermansiaceae bacterium]|nr:1-acyl-sn-glycerol-3-phosphate acyltransferase [Akkermansiaceae bacterium]MCF7733615.1 1-acyl-sn-glycerol-3-phosphate acyltransferase [Akkermansiaceae bacterium]
MRNLLILSAFRLRLMRMGSVLLVANHANSLIDPVLVGLVARRRVSFLAKAPLFEVPVFGRLIRWLGMIPVFRPKDDPAQTKRSLVSLSQAAGELAAGAAVGIFPEGKTHDQRALAEVLSGTARLIQQAVDAGGTGLQVVPVGINYDDKRLFRSAVWIEVGEPLEVAELMAAAGSAPAARRELTREIAGRLREVMIHLDRHEMEPFLEDLEVLDPQLAAPGREKVFSLQQRKIVADALNHYCRTSPETVASMGRALVAHRAHLQKHGLRVGSPVLNQPGWRRLLGLVWSTARLAFGLLPVACGVLQNLPPWIVERLIVRCLPQAGATTIALSRLGVAFPVFGLWYAFTWWLLVGYFLPWVAWFWVLATPFAGLFALRYLRAGRVILGGWLEEIRMLAKRPVLTDLRATQEKLRRRIRSLSHAYDALRPPLPEKRQQWIHRPAVRFGLLTAMLGVACGYFVYCGVRVGFTDRALEVLVAPAPRFNRMSEVRIKELLRVDEARLVRTMAALDRLETRAVEISAAFDAGRHSFLNDADNDLISRELLTYLNCRQELLGVVLAYRSHQTIAEPGLRMRAAQLQLAAGCTLYRHATSLAAVFEDSPQARRRLNEGEPAWGIPAGIYDMVRGNLANERNLTPFRTAMADYQARAGDYEAAGLLAGEPQGRFHRMIAGTRISPPRDSGFFAKWMRQADEVRAGWIYRGQSAVSRAVGSTRLRQRDEGPRVSPGQIEEIRRRVKPGDILLERQDWYLSRAFMPGYWAHAALYLGTPEEVEALGLANHEWVAPHWAEFKRGGPDGQLHAIIEAVPEGVRFTTLEHCLGVADSVAVLRPARITREDVKEVVARAFHHLGKEYDFEFDFFSADKLVCTELVCRAYAGNPRLGFKVVRVMGRETLPPTEMARKFAAERRLLERQLDLVIFLDGHAQGSTAVEGGEDAFAGTIERPGMTWFSSAD